MRVDLFHHLSLQYFKPNYINFWHKRDIRTLFVYDPGFNQIVSALRFEYAELECSKEQYI